MTMLDRRSVLLGAGASFALAGCTAAAQPRARATARAARLIETARRQIGVTIRYDPAYTKLAFPMATCRG
jgi:hypothetical protein